MEQQEIDLKQVVVLGAGNWVKEQYAKALRPYQERGECKVFIVYDTRYAAARRGLTAEQIKRYNQFTLDNVREFEAWGATCLDLSEPTDQAKMTGISPYAVFVVTPDDTHCDMAEAWLDRAANIIVEKPFDVDYERIRRLRRTLAQRRNAAAVWGFDHYLVRANQFVRMKEYLGFDEHVEEQIHEFRFHMLESADRGLVERSASLQAGLIIDMGSHTPALVLPFGDPNTIRLDAVTAGVYRPNPAQGITTSGRELITSGMETFAEIHFSFTSVFGHTVQATACIGKCVGEQDEKYVEVVGGRKRDRKVRLDLSSFIVDFIGGKNPGPVTSLFSNPVYLLVREVMAGRHLDSLALFDPGVGQDIVARLHEWRRPIIDRVRGGDPLAEYPARESLEKILAALTPPESPDPLTAQTTSAISKAGSPTMAEVQQVVSQAFVEEVQKLQGVTGVFVRYEDDMLHVWTVINAEHEDIRPDIYARELALMEECAGVQQFAALEYDFHVMSGSPHTLAEQLPPEAEEIFSRSADDAIRASTPDTGTPQ